MQFTRWGRPTPPSSPHWGIHRLNMDPKLGLVEGVEVTVNVPASKTPKGVYYAYPDRRSVDYSASGDGLTFKVRPFDVHEMVVVEF